MKRGDARTIMVNGVKLEASYLGAGTFCTAWRVGDRVYCFVDEEDLSKEILAHPTCGLGGDGLLHIPEVTQHADDETRGKFRRVYSMPFYEEVSPRSKEAWQVLKTLQKEREWLLWGNPESPYKPYGKRWPLEVWGSSLNQDVIDRTQGKVPESVTVALQKLADAAANYGHGMTFEFAKRNVGVDGEGRIVFRDCLFDSKVVRERADEKMRATGRAWGHR